VTAFWQEFWLYAGIGFVAAFAIDVLANLFL